MTLKDFWSFRDEIVFEDFWAGNICFGSTLESDSHFNTVQPHSITKPNESTGIKSKRVKWLGNQQKNINAKRYDDDADQTTKKNYTNMEEKTFAQCVHCISYKI